LDPPLLLVLRLRRVVFKHISSTKSKIIFKSFINNRSELNGKRRNSNHIEKELEQNPEITSIDIAKKHRIPLVIVELLKRKIKNQ
jgi:hypothetical protein